MSKPVSFVDVDVRLSIPKRDVIEWLTGWIDDFWRDSDFDPEICNTETSTKYARKIVNAYSTSSVEGELLNLSDMVEAILIKEVREYYKNNFDLFEILAFTGTDLNFETAVKKYISSKEKSKPAPKKTSTNNEVLAELEKVADKFGYKIVKK